jgi:hypothetical protein
MLNVDVDVGGWMGPSFRCGLVSGWVTAALGSLAWLSLA